MTSRQNAQIGVAYLEAAVLAILEDAPEEGLEPNEISKLLGIRRYSDPRGNRMYAIVHGILIKLKDKGLAQRVDEEDTQNSHWQLQTPQK